MSRKFRATEISGNVNMNEFGQWNKRSFYCTNCNKIAHSPTHYPNCDNRGNIYSIPSTAEVPRKKSSKRIWEIFKKQFVYAKPITQCWNYIEESYYYKNIIK